MQTPPQPPQTRAPIAPLEKRVSAAVLQTGAGAISETINGLSALVEAVPIIGWAVSWGGGVGSYLTNKVEGLVLKADAIFANDPTRARLVATGGRLALIPIAGPYLAGVEDAVTMFRAWANVVNPEFVRDKMDPALNKAMGFLSAVKLSPKDGEPTVPSGATYTATGAPRMDQGPTERKQLHRQPDGTYREEPFVASQAPPPGQTPPQSQPAAAPRANDIPEGWAPKPVRPGERGSMGGDPFRQGGGAGGDRRKEARYELP